MKNKNIFFWTIAALLILISCHKKEVEVRTQTKNTNNTSQSKDTVKQTKPASKETGFNKQFELYGITFDISSPNNSSINSITITPKGLKNDNSPITVEADGTITNAQIADLDLDQSPEIYIFINSAGSGSYGSLIAYSCNNKKSLSEIYLPDLNEDKTNSKGYAGHDEMQIIENTLSRRFNLYNQDYKPTSIMRQLQYKLTKGETGYVLKLDKSFDMDLKKQ